MQNSDTITIFLISNKWWYGTKIAQDIGMSGRECMDQWRIFKKNHVADVLNLPSILEVSEYLLSRYAFFLIRKLSTFKLKLW